jgi:hypothetical protein
MTQKSTNASTSNDITAKGGEANSLVGQNRIMSKDYERLSESSEAFIYVAMTRLMVRPIGPLMRLFSRFLNRMRSYGYDVADKKAQAATADFAPCTSALISEKCLTI